MQPRQSIFHTKHKESSQLLGISSTHVAFEQIEEQQNSSKWTLPEHVKWYDVGRYYTEKVLHMTLLHGRKVSKLPLHKHLGNIRKTNSYFMYFDAIVVFGSLLLCGNYIAETYRSSYNDQVYFRLSEIVFTCVFALDFTLSWFTAPNALTFLFMKWTTYVDILTIIPVLVQHIMGISIRTSGTYVFRLLRFTRIFKMLRIAKVLRRFYNLSAYDLQLTKLVMILITLVLIAAGVVEIFENDVKMMYFYDCKYSNAATNWLPSCTEHAPAIASCDCSLNFCTAEHDRFDRYGEPSRVRCVNRPFFECIYYVMVTISTIGYGDFYPSFTGSRMVVIFLIFITVVFIPAQIRTLSSIITNVSGYRKRFEPSIEESHVIVTGRNINREKIELFFREFFSEDRALTTGSNFIALIVSNEEPSDDIVAFLDLSVVDNKMSYRIGSISNYDDMKRVSASTASGLFYLCDNVVTRHNALYADIETAMHLLSFRSLAPDVDIFAEVHIGNDRKDMFEDEVDVLLTFSEYKSSIMARNALCPGFSALVETMIMSVATSSAANDSMWLNEYMHGCGKEVYLVKLPEAFREEISYSYTLFVQLVYVELSLICLGICDNEQENIILNPTVLEVHDFLQSIGRDVECESGNELFFAKYAHVLVLADSFEDAFRITNFRNIQSIASPIQKLHENEKEFPSSLRFQSQNTSMPSSVDSGRISPSSELLSKSPKFLPGDSFDEDVYVSMRAKSLVKRSIDIRTYYDKVHRDASSVHNYLDYSRGVASIETISDASNLTNHIVVIGGGQNCFLILRELRRPLIRKHNMHPVVFFGETHPIEHHNQEETDEVYYIKGVAKHIAKHRKDFNKLNLQNAFSVVVFVDEFLDNTSDVIPKSLDTDLFHLYITITNTIKNFPNVYFSMELCSPENLSAINLKVLRGLVKKIEDVENESASIINEKKLIVQASRPNNTASSEKHSESLHVNSFWDLKERTISLPIYASGKAFIAQAFDSLLLQSYFSHFAAKFFEILITGQKYQTMLQVSIPDEFVDVSFGHVFRVFAVRSVLVISIYRAGENVSNIDDLKKCNALPYVFTCPQSEAKILPGDRMFVFSHPDVVTEVLNEFKFQNSSSMSHKQNRSSPVTTLDSVTFALPSKDSTVSGSKSYEMRQFRSISDDGVSGGGLSVTSVPGKEDETTNEDDQKIVEVW